jgi:hypothetical protein
VREPSDGRLDPIGLESDEAVQPELVNGFCAAWLVIDHRWFPPLVMDLAFCGYHTYVWTDV